MLYQYVDNGAEKGRIKFKFTSPIHKNTHRINYHESNVTLHAIKTTYLSSSCSPHPAQLLPSLLTKRVAVFV
jgi:hypothetical protein